MEKAFQECDLNHEGRWEHRFYHPLLAIHLDVIDTHSSLFSSQANFWGVQDVGTAQSRDCRLHRWLSVLSCLSYSVAWNTVPYLNLICLKLASPTPSNRFNKFILTLSFLTLLPHSHHTKQRGVHIQRVYCPTPRAALWMSKHTPARRSPSHTWRGI